MKQALFAMLLMFGVSGSVFACDGSGHQTKSTTATPAAPAAPVK
jgi:hypothetical protein